VLLRKLPDHVVLQTLRRRCVERDERDVAGAAEPSAGELSRRAGLTRRNGTVVWLRMRGGLASVALPLAGTSTVATGALGGGEECKWVKWRAG
jgi:hypothetical protein